MSSTVRWFKIYSINKTHAASQIKQRSAPFPIIPGTLFVPGTIRGIYQTIWANVLA